MTLRSIAPLALVVAAIGAACADASTGPGGTSSPAIDHSTSPGDVLLRWGYEGGFTPPGYQLTNLPSFTLYGDGTILRPGPQIEIYPPPALPAIEALHVDEAAVAEILQAAFDARLDTVGDLTDMGSVGVADAPETVFTLRAGGVDRTARVYALSELGGQPQGMPDEEYGSRQALLSLVGDLGSLESWLPDGSIEPGGVFEPDGARIFVSDYHGQPDLEQPEIAWPLSTPLEQIGEDAGAGFRCLVVTGSEWSERLAPLAATANQLTPWTSERRRYAISFRPLLPDETGC